MKRLILLIPVMCLFLVSSGYMTKLNNMSKISVNTNNADIRELVELYDDIMIQGGKPYLPTQIKKPVNRLGRRY